MIREVTTAGVTGNRGKVEEAPQDAFVELPVGFAEGSDCADVMPEDMATVAIGMFDTNVEAIELFTAAVERVNESSIFDAGLVSGNLEIAESVLVAVGVVPVVLTVLVTAPAASPLFISGATATGVCSTG